MPLLHTLITALSRHVARTFRYNVHQQSHQSSSGMCRYVRPVDMARHSQFVGEEARDAKSKEARRSLIHTGNWEEKEKEEECANYKAEHDPQPQGSDDRTGHCQVEFPAAAKAVGRATSEGTAASRRGLDVSCTAALVW